MACSREARGLRFSFWSSMYDATTTIIGYGTSFRNATLDAMAIAGFPMRGVVVDAGCGTGQLIITMLDRLERGSTIIGIDPEPAMLAVARQSIRLYPAVHDGQTRVRFVDGYMQHMPLETASIDTVVSTMTFHHLDRRQKARSLREVLRVLKPGGYFLLVDFGFGTLATSKRARFSRWLALAGFLYFNVMETFAGRFMTMVVDHFTGALPIMVARAGFSNVRCVRPGFRRAVFLACQKPMSQVSC